MQIQSQYWEEQGDDTCAVHAVNMLLGRPAYAPADFDKMAREIDISRTLNREHWEGLAVANVPAADYSAGTLSKNWEIDVAVRVLASTPGVQMDGYSSKTFPTQKPDYVGTLILTKSWSSGGVGHYTCVKNVGGRLYLLDSLRPSSSSNYTTARRVRQLVEAENTVCFHVHGGSAAAAHEKVGQEAKTPDPVGLPATAMGDVAAEAGEFPGEPEASDRSIKATGSDPMQTAEHLPPKPAMAGRPSEAEGNGSAETAEPPLVRAGKTGGVAQEKSNAPTPPAKSQATEPKAAGRPTKAKRRDSLTVAGPLAKKPDSSQRRPLFLGATNSTDFPRDQPAQPDGAAPEEVGAGREVSYQTGASPKTGALPTARRPTLATVGSLGHFCLTPRGSATQGRSKRGCV